MVTKYVGNTYVSNLQANQLQHDEFMWIFDSGATCPIGTHENLFSQIFPLKTQS